MSVNWYTTARRGLLTPNQRIHFDISQNNGLAGGDQYIRVCLDRLEYRPGEEVRGQIILNMVESVRVSAAAITLEVFGEYHTDYLYISSASKHHHEKMGKETHYIIKECIDVDRFADEVPIGQLFLPFSFKLPLNLVPSLHWQDEENVRVWVSYGIRVSLRTNLEAVENMFFPANMVDWQEFSVIGPAYSMDNSPVCLEREFYVYQKLFSPKGSVKVTLNFDRRYYAPGDVIHCRATFNTVNLKIPLASTKLKLRLQIETLRTEVTVDNVDESLTVIPAGADRTVVEYSLLIPDDFPAPCSLAGLNIRPLIRFSAEIPYGLNIVWDIIISEGEISLVPRCHLQPNEDVMGREMSADHSAQLDCLPNFVPFTDSIRFIPRRSVIRAGEFLEGLILVKHSLPSPLQLQLNLFGKVEGFEERLFNRHRYKTTPLIDATYLIDDAVPAGELLRYPVKIRIASDSVGSFAELFSSASRYGMISYRVEVGLRRGKDLIAQHQLPIFIHEIARQPIHTPNPPIVRSFPIIAYGCSNRGIIDVFFSLLDGHLVPGRTASAIFSLDAKLAKISLASNYQVKISIRRTVVLQEEEEEVDSESQILATQRLQLVSAHPVNLVLKLPIPVNMHASVSHEDCRVNYQLEVEMPIVRGCTLRLSQPVQMVCLQPLQPPDHHSSHHLNAIDLGTVVIP